MEQHPKSSNCGIANALSIIKGAMKTRNTHSIEHVMLMSRTNTSVIDRTCQLQKWIDTNMLTICDPMHFTPSGSVETKNYTNRLLRSIAFQYCPFL